MSAALLIYPEFSDDFIIITGTRHDNCFESLKNLNVSYDKNRVIKGFWVSNNRFVSCSEAAEIAKVLGYKLKNKAYLEVEDIWNFEKKEDIDGF